MLVAMDRSTAVGSAALFSDQGERIVSVSDVGAGRGDAYDLFSLLMAESGGISIRTLTRFAVGIGPGSFSGIRSTLALFSGLALPTDTTIEGVNSAAAIEAAFRAEHPETGTVVVIGDARRGHLWLSCFVAESEPCHHADDFQLVDRHQIAAHVPTDAIVLTPDGERIGALLESSLPSTLVLSITPSADAIGRLALRGSSAAALPIYLHPAVV